MEETTGTEASHWVRYDDLAPEEIDEILGEFEVSAEDHGNYVIFRGTQAAVFGVAVWYHNYDGDAAERDVREA